MDNAWHVFANESRFNNEKVIVTARQVGTRENARKMWPLVTVDEPPVLLTWVSPVFEGSKLRRRSHFRKLPKAKSVNAKTHFDAEEQVRRNQVAESERHRKAKELIIAELRHRVKTGLAMSWSFKDEAASDFHLEGNFLLNADQVEGEYRLKTQFGSEYRLDVAILAQPIAGSEIPLVLGGVEIELNHDFDGRKALLCKSLGFPLISVDITGMLLGELTEQWARKALSETTSKNTTGWRRSYVYVHEILYPLFVQLPLFVNKEQRHQYLIFAPDSTLDKLLMYFHKVSNSLGYEKTDVVVSVINGKSEQARLILERVGEITGRDWHTFNANRCIRLVLPRPLSVSDKQTHLLHFKIITALLARPDVLVGYQYKNTAFNEFPESSLWIRKQYFPQENRSETYRVLPKRLSEPVGKVLDFVNSLSNDRED
ncbi:hypothetical protein GCM10009007_18960 [Formosimonas limnophila]|uniref:Uncharacterized protein n=1 Tax=Formosimonas limnophila TaxID=1384487 RepID=A0A8J3CMF4_9BURK|nr:hypothetical protein [Formosimonas limnophila]GHA78196.1 hypothetical protein GCM10009007_18960 [Formosimonas limnophila]